MQSMGVECSNVAVNHSSKAGALKNHSELDNTKTLICIFEVNLENESIAGLVFYFSHSVILTRFLFLQMAPVPRNKFRKVFDV